MIFLNRCLFFVSIFPQLLHLYLTFLLMVSGNISQNPRCLLNHSHLRDQVAQHVSRTTLQIKLEQQTEVPQEFVAIAHRGQAIRGDEAFIELKVERIEAVGATEEDGGR